VIAHSPVVRMGLAVMVEENPQVSVIKSIADLDLSIEELQPDLILLDWHNLDRESLDLISQLNTATIVLIDVDEDIEIIDILAAGVRGILPQHITEIEIDAAIVAVVRGFVVLHPEISAKLQWRSPLNLVENRELTSTMLTAREMEILQMLAEGSTNKAIAQRLYISEHTVKFHVSSIFAKLKVSSRTEAVAKGLRSGSIVL
jgi:two-component system, NarL family, response regulator YdfI